MEPLVSRHPLLFSLLYFTVVSLLCPVRSGDAEALLTLKSAIDPLKSLPWQHGTNVCKWQGVKECKNGRVTKLVVEYQNLSGPLEAKILNQLDQLRVLSFKGNSLSGQIPNLSGLVNLKSLFLDSNNFSGEFPDSITGLHRLKVIVLARNQISGPIPVSILNLSRLYALYLEDNNFTGAIPPLNQTSLRFFNVSNNKLSGQIPVTPPLIRFNTPSFIGNLNLCGVQIQNPCNDLNFGPSLSPTYPSSKPTSKRSKTIKIVAATAGGFVFLITCLLLVCCFCFKNGNKKEGPSMVEERNKGVVGVERGGEASGGVGGMDGNNGGRQGGFSWESEGLGSLVFLGAGDQQMSYSLEDLLKASAETLGRGTIGSTYKAVMESGFIVTVKRLKDARYPRLEEFRRHMDLLGRLRHPSLVPLRAYFQAKEERLIVYDYFPNGSLFSLLHGTRTSGGGKPLHWTSCLKIAEDLATGLLYIHQNPGLTHGNLKSSNVLLGPEFESCLTDYGLTMFQNPDSLEEPSATSLFYRAPEIRDVRKPSTQPADVYSFGVLLLELLTGKTPFQDLVQEHGPDIPRWVRSVREEETESGDDPASGNEAAEEKLQALVNIAMACVSLTPDNRPSMRDVLRMIRDARAEARVSSNSSDHSPGRWSDTVQSLPREEHLSI
ncbi:PREDICTED: inactive leucine-rich repeat receptor-like serine/threonine-protein kinase At1g60630 [Populus euphratica]|uniref:Inactive leucine-rich repeat receptor-like serine/threonine-protein kinase At1g60630 n=1 Tax=Populus euphratica TaxID=75702 RepID=A0AAJ6U1Q6_POPEU|nr:PREDICTED: inactive leucine-rich repeat receptor-like serine/threonine-protein kinase At1g60630 [Populus euphratica]